MRLRALRLTNFRQHADSAIEFGPGITGIIGPNGTGKTTILEAIAWALYGNEAARGRRDSIRFVRADPKASVRVELEFDLAGHRYRVVRGITSAELYLDGGEQPIANSLSSVSELLQRRIGMSRSEFFNTYFTGQKELSVMTSFGPTERGQFLSRVLGYERLRTAQELARDKRRQLLSELNGLRQGMPDPDAVTRALSDATARLADASRRAAESRTARDLAETRLHEVGPRWETAQRDRALYQQAASDLRYAELDLTTRLRDRDRATQELAEAEAAASEVAKVAPLLVPLPALRAEREALDAMAREEGRRQALIEGAKAADDELVRLAATRARLEVTAPVDAVSNELEAARVALRTADQALEAARTEWVRDRQEAETKRDALRVQYTDVKAQIDRITSLGAEGICPTCQRPLGTHFREFMNLLNEQIEAVKVDGNYYKARVEQLDPLPPHVLELEGRRRELLGELGALERNVARAQAAGQELAEVVRTMTRQEQRVAAMRADLESLPTGYDAARHGVVRAELDRLSALEQRTNKITMIAEQADVARSVLTAAAAACASAEARVGALRLAVASYAADDLSFEQLRLAHERATADLQSAQVAMARADAEAAASLESLARATAAREELARSEARLDLITRERRLHDELDHAFTDLRTDLNFALRPELSKLASGFLAQLTDSRYTELDLDDQYNLVIVEDGTPKPVISGGEEDLANLVLRLAISQMIAERAGQAFSLLILDEVFGSLDDVRRQSVVDLLRALHDRFEQVILITHIESVRDGCDRVLMVRYDAGTGAAVVQSEENATMEPELLVGAEP